MESAGFWMLALVAIGLVATGLPAFVVLIGVAVLFSVLGVAGGFVSYHLLAAVPARITGLLDSDILQALPLYVLMGALLNHLPLADIVFRAASRGFARGRAAPLLAAFGLGALLAPMSGSVGASVASLSRIVQPKLVASGVARRKASPWSASPARSASSCRPRWSSSCSATPCCAPIARRSTRPASWRARSTPRTCFAARWCPRGCSSL
jgi:TRAP-type mannitol/chloroaromatic compound transport system permease large subunit